MTVELIKDMPLNVRNSARSARSFDIHPDQPNREYDGLYRYATIGSVRYTIQPAIPSRYDSRPCGIVIATTGEVFWRYGSAALEIPLIHEVLQEIQEDYEYSRDQYRLINHITNEEAMLLGHYTFYHVSG